MPTVPLCRIRSANQSAGLHFFDADSMRFFRSRIESQSAHVAADGVTAYFVTSEQFVGSDRIAAPRLYTVRVANLTTGDVKTLGDFNKIVHRSDALEAARNAAKAPALAPIT